MQKVKLLKENLFSVAYITLDTPI